MTLWSDFLRRLMVTAALSNPAAGAAEPPTDPPPEPPAEVGDPFPLATAAAPRDVAQAPRGPGA